MVILDFHLWFFVFNHLQKYRVLEFLGIELRETNGPKMFLCIHVYSVLAVNHCLVIVSVFVIWILRCLSWMLYIILYTYFFFFLCGNLQNISDQSLHLIADNYQELEVLNLTRYLNSIPKHPKLRKKRKEKQINKKSNDTLWRFLLSC